MDVNTSTAATIKAQIAKYSGIISQGFSKAKKRLIKELGVWDTGKQRC